MTDQIESLGKLSIASIAVAGLVYVLVIQTNYLSELKEQNRIHLEEVRAIMRDQVANEKILINQIGEVLVDRMSSDE